MKVSFLRRSVVLFSAVICMCCMCICCSASAYAEGTFTSGAYTYEVNDDAATLVAVSPAVSGELRLPSVFDRYPVTAIGEYAFEGCKNITDVIIPEEIVSIGDYAFSRCEQLKNVVFGSGMESIGEFAFDGCGMLNDILIPENTTQISTTAFEGCKALRSFKVENGNPSYVSFDGVLYNKKMTTLQRYPIGKKGGSYTVPQDVKSIASYAFYDCENLTEVSLPDTLTSVASYAFTHCINLKELTCPDSLNSIGEYAFASCENLTKVSLPAQMGKLGEGVFQSCYALKELVIPQGITNIYPCLCANCSSLSKVSLPAELERISSYAFENCYDLKEIVLPDSVTDISHYAFRDCDGLECITFSDNLRTIGKRSFDGCISLKAVSFPESLTDIGEYAFYNCDGMREISVPETVTTIGAYAFGFYEDGEAIADTSIKLSGQRGSAMEAYARKYGAAFIPFDGCRHENLKHITEESTCTEKGRKYDVCIDCDLLLNEKALSLAEHTDEDKNYLCDVCSQCLLSSQKPTGLKVKSQNSNTISFTWDKIANAAGYRFYIYNDSLKKFEKYADVKTNSLKMADLSAGTAMTVGVKANMKVAGKTYWSLMSAKLYGATGPAKVSGLEQVTANSTSITLSWKSVKKADGYRVYSYQASDGSYKLLSQLTGTQVKIDNLNPVKKYYLVVRAYTKTDNVKYYGTMSNVCISYTAPAKTSLSSTGVDSTSVSLNWKAVDKATGYRVYLYNPASMKYEKYADTSATSLKVTSLASNKKVYFKVKAYRNVDGVRYWSTVSEPLTLTTGAKKVTSLKASPSKTSAKITWAKATGADSYRVYLYNAKTDEYQKVKDVTATSCTVSSLKANTSYKVMVKSLKKVGKTTILGTGTTVSFKTKK